MRYTSTLLALLILFSCDSNQKTGIEGNNNSNNTVIVADKVEYPDEEAKKYKENFDITSQGVGGILIGQSLDEVQIFYKKNANYSFEIDEGARGEGTDFNFPIIYVKNANNEGILGLRSYDMRVIDGIEVYSEKYKTYNGIHVGMTVQELSSIYQNNLILEEDYIIDEEYFTPFDLNGTKASTLIYVSANDGGSLIEEKAPIYSDAKKSPGNYKTTGIVKRILINKLNE